MFRFRRWGACAALGWALACAGAQAATFTVTSTADSGAGSLREAITAANADSARSTILFNLPPGAVISPATALPALTNPVGIHINGNLAVTISGADLSGTADGLTLQSGGHVVEGLIIVSFPRDGILVAGDGGNRISRCRVGTDGDAALGNGAFGIHVRSSNNVIGRDPIAGTGGGNVLSGNNISGLVLTESTGGQLTTGHRVHGNYIGTNAAGTAAVGNGATGLLHQTGAADIGGTTSQTRNVISGNGLSGMAIGSSVSVLPRIIGNHIGVNAVGNAAIPNGQNGIVCQRQGAVIGGSQPGEGNVISGNQFFGIQLVGSACEVLGNRIGVAAKGNEAIGNGLGGIRVAENTTDHRIGGVAAAEQNIIANNGNFGVDIDPNVFRTVVRINSIYSHNFEGIGKPITSNNGILPPVITGVDPITGTAAPDAAVDLYADEAGEGRYYVGTTTANAEGAFTAAFDLGPYAGLNLTAVATLTGSSKFSAPFEIPDEMPAPPAAPGAPLPVSKTTTTITRSWLDNSPNEDGFRIYADPFPPLPGTLRATLAADENTWTHEGLTPNTAYAARVEAFNEAGTSALSTFSTAYTLPGPPSPGNNVLGMPGPGETQAPGAEFTFSNPEGFGPGTDGGSIHRVASFLHVWTTSEDHNFSGEEDVWESGTLVLNAPAPGHYYLHLLPRNLTDDSGDPLAYGPFVVEGAVCGACHSADTSNNFVIALSEVLRVIQLFNSGGLFCAVPAESTEDGFLPGVNAAQRDCTPHQSDYNPQDWRIALTELLRLIQFYNSGAYNACPGEGTEDGFCPGAG